MRPTLTIIIASTAVLLVSCTMLKPERDNVLEGYTPETFSRPAGPAERQVQWWKSFGSAQLDHLMAEAFAGSLTLEQSFARLEQAEAAARKAGAAGKVQLDGRGSTSSRYQSNFNNTGNSRTDPDFTLGLYASYELDLWGRIKSSTQAAQATYEASRFDVQTAGISLAAELARSYFTWQAEFEALRLYESQLASNRNKLTALERRYKTGLATALAVLQQRQQVAANEARIPPVRARIKAIENAITVLIGKIPGTDLGLEPEPLPDLPPLPNAGLPADLLENRPDLQAARLKLESADWSVGAARAALLPSISLTGNITTSGEQIDQLFDDWASNLAAGLLAPILDGGARSAEVDRTLAVSRERIAAYRLAVLQAIQDTEDALSNEKHQADYVAAVAKQYDAARKSESESLRRYQRGILEFLDALTAVVARENLEIIHLQARADLISDRIQLYRALGGDWTFLLEDQ